MVSYESVVTIIAVLALLVALHARFKLSRLRNGAESDNRPVPPKEMWERVKKVDLSRVREALRRKKIAGDEILRDEELYRKFLFLNGITTERIVPWSEGLDRFWHEHVLDLQKYIKDCNMLFGGILFHRPFITRDALKQRQLADRTMELYKSAFVPPRNASRKSLARYQQKSGDDGGAPWIIFVDSGSASPAKSLAIVDSDATVGGPTGDPSASSCSSCSS